MFTAAESICHGSNLSAGAKPASARIRRSGVLQLLRIDVSAYALKLGLRTKKTDITCTPMTPPAGEGWYRERTLMIEKASPDVVRKVLEFSVMDLVRLWIW